MTVTPATDASFDELLAIDERPVLVEFSAAWCPPCRAMPPILDALARAHADSIRVITVDEDDAPDLFVRERVTSMPTFKLFESGVARRTLVGAQPLRSLEAALGLA